MYEELIAKMNPCPKFNLQWYKNEDLYSDGEVEDFIIKIIAENRPEDYSNAVYEQFNWPIYYHLSPLRKNILNYIFLIFFLLLNKKLLLLLNYYRV